MQNAITLQWKEFSVPVERLVAVLKTLLTDNYDGIICEETQFHVIFKEEISEADAQDLNNFWNTAQQVQFSPSLKEILTGKINLASAFGRSLILDFAVDNVQIGITQSGKTRAVSNYCRALQRYLESGSLYAAIEEINEMITVGPPSELSPFITVARLTSYRDRIIVFASAL